MLSANLVKYINSLSHKKHREIHNAFVVEGIKSVEEVCKSDFKILHLFYTKIPENIILKNLTHQLITEHELKKISNLTSPNQLLAVCEIPKKTLPKNLENQWTIVLDEINDPGNLGTIIRLADWFGIENIFCSHNSVDLFNPKVIQSSKGSFTRVNVFYEHLEEILCQFDGEIISGDLEGENLYNFVFPSSGILLFGNEANGIRASTKQWITKTTSIPKTSKNQQIESLNLAMATAITLGELFSQKNRKFV